MCNDNITTLKVKYSGILSANLKAQSRVDELEVLEHYWHMTKVQPTVVNVL